MKEINYKEMKFNPFNLIGGEWMLVTAGNEQSGCIILPETALIII